MPKNKVLFSFTISPQILSEFREYSKLENKKMSRLLEEKIIELLDDRIDKKINKMMNK